MITLYTERFYNKDGTVKNHLVETKFPETKEEADANKETLLTRLDNLMPKLQDAVAKSIADALCSYGYEEDDGWKWLYDITPYIHERYTRDQVRLALTFKYNVPAQLRGYFNTFPHTVETMGERNMQKIIEKNLDDVYAYYYFERLDWYMTYEEGKSIIQKFYLRFHF